MISRSNDSHWNHEVSVRRYRRLLETHLTETERRFVEQRLVEEQQACRQTAGTDQGRQRPPGHVHVVDDDAAFRTALERRLKKAGYEVVTYQSAQHLLDRLPSESEFGCILLDVRLPGLSGPELQGRLNDLARACPSCFSRATPMLRPLCGPSRRVRRIF